MNKILIILMIIAGTLTLAFTGLTIFETKAESEAKYKGIEVYMKELSTEMRIVREDIKKLLERSKHGF